MSFRWSYIRRRDVSAAKSTRWPSNSGPSTQANFVWPPISTRQPPQERIKGFSEVALGYTPELAVLEASRCLSCKTPKCIEGCPVLIDIPGFIKLIAEKDFIGAARKLREFSDLPAVCGRVCPQETQCEQFCVLG